MKLIALTGGIASGKSTVARMFEQLGAVVLDADRLAHQIYRRGTPLYRMLLKRYGSTLLSPSGQIDRKRLGNILFGSKKEKKWLESQIHPATFFLIGKKIRQALAHRPPLVLVEAALHFETGYHRFFPRVVLVTAKRKQQIERMKIREGLSSQEAQVRLNQQMPLAQKKRMADVIIDNSGNLKNTQRQVEGLFKKWTR